MDRWTGKVAIVTGASSGIGAAITAELVTAGLKVVGVARRQEKVELLSEKLQNKSGKLYAIKGDITKEEDILEVFKWTKENLGPVHILINNAGIARMGHLTEMDAKFMKEVLDTNVLGLSIATKEAVNDMRANNIDGHIIHINSVTGHTIPQIPALNMYPATKHAVTALTEILRRELNLFESKIKITSVSPGIVKTDLANASNLAVHGRTDMPDIIKELPSLDPEDVVDAVIYILGTPPHVQVHELTLKPIGEVLF